MKHLNITIHGRVQGVFFRDSTQRKAQELGITGWVRNDSSGAVQIKAEGEENNLKKFLAWCYDGPSSAKVFKVNYNFSDNLKRFDKFEILY